MRVVAGWSALQASRVMSTTQRRSRGFHTTRLLSNDDTTEPTPKPTMAEYYDKLLSISDDITNAISNRDLVRKSTSRETPRFTLFPPAGQVKANFIRMLAKDFVPKRSVLDRGRNAAVILASPRYASWITDDAFMTDLVCSIHRAEDETLSEPQENFHLLAAVVDGMVPKPPGSELQEGISLQFGSLDSLLPGLWDEPSQPALPESDDETSSISVRLAQADKDVTVTLPLANTLFHNKQWSTLVASEWQPSHPGFSRCACPFELKRSLKKRSQTIGLSMPENARTLIIRSPLLPITPPRKILKGLGNILAEIDVGRKTSPASQELQTNIDRLIKARQSQFGSEYNPGPVAVWAMIIPKILIGGRPNSLKTIINHDEAVLRFYLTCGARDMSTGCDKLAFDFSGPDEAEWEKSQLISNILCKGGHLHKILSGGGEWGTKAQLLALDPQTSHGLQSEEKKLEDFQDAFIGVGGHATSIVKSGDFVQFFVEGGLGSLPQRQNKGLLEWQPKYPQYAFGVGHPRLERTGSQQGLIRRPTQHQLIEYNHFGGFSAEGVYLSSSKLRLNTKVDTPKTTVCSAAHSSDERNRFIYQKFKRPEFLRKLNNEIQKPAQ